MTFAFADGAAPLSPVGPTAFVTCDFVSTAAAPVSAQFNPVTVEDASEGAPIPTPAVPFPTMSAAVGACAPTAPACGNSVVESGEACDDGIETANCNDDCTLSACGDDNLNLFDGEECDDGNLTDGDGCNPTCQLDCGDNAPDPGEQCDDGNETDGDGCSTRCADTGDCPATPRLTCVSGGSSSVSFKDDVKTPASNVKDQAKYGVKKVATEIADGLIGDPQGGATVYKFCVYDSVGLLLGADIDPGTGWSCKLDPGKESCQYKNKDGNAFGISSVKVKAGAAGKGQASVAAKTKLGTFASPTMPLPEPVRAQLLVDTGSSLCFDAQFPTATKNDGVKGQYQAKTP
jgi:cysteine-rich repeat protein